MPTIRLRIVTTSRGTTGNDASGVVFPGFIKDPDSEEGVRRDPYFAPDWCEVLAANLGGYAMGLE